MFHLMNKKALSHELKCRVKTILPDEELEFGYTVNSVGLDLFDELVRKLDLLDKDYFGLKIEDQMQWLDLSKSISKQTKPFLPSDERQRLQSPLILQLRFKYYPAEPALLVNESTRYYLYLQLRSDLIEGRLRSECQNIVAYLIACVLQSELGDSSAHSSNRDNYVSEFKFVPNQGEQLELAAMRLHQSEDFLGLTPAEAELNFLKKARTLDTYGIDPFPVMDGKSQHHFLIGVNHLGIATFQDSKLITRFKWNEIIRLKLDGKILLIFCRRMGKDGAKTKPLFGFRSPSQACAQNLWKICTEHRYFFTLESTPDEPIVANTGSFFKRSRLKYSGRVEKDLLKDQVEEEKSCGVKRSHSLMSKSIDGPRWQGFGQEKTLQTSLSNIYANEYLNKTLPANMNYFREEDESDSNRGYEQDEDEADGLGQVEEESEEQRRKKQNSDSIPSRQATMSNREGRNSKTSNNFTRRRSVLTSKSFEPGNGGAIRKGSQIYMDTRQRTNDFYKTSIFLLLLIAGFLIVILLINDSDRTNTVNLLVKKMGLETISLNLRENYYLPLKSTIRGKFSQLYSLLLAGMVF